MRKAYVVFEGKGSSRQIAYVYMDQSDARTYVAHRHYKNQLKPFMEDYKEKCDEYIEEHKLI